MRRALPILLATVAVLALLAGFHTSPGTLHLATAQPPVVTTAPTSPSTSEAPDSTTTSPPAGGAAPPTSTSPTTVSATRTVSGPVVQTSYGNVQVRVTLQGSKITDVQALELPSDRSRSQRISQEAGPLLRSEALQAQSADIDIISGASYTSEGYAQSLQGALDKAGQ
jgi:uncharacterized protein with FMN-binding domain